jgi:hypothetical protein
MFRIHFLQLLNSYSDPAMQEAMYAMPVYRWLICVDEGASRLSDDSTILQFWRFRGEGRAASRKAVDNLAMLYCWHAPGVECISRGESRRPYKSRVKAGLAMMAQGLTYRPIPQSCG